MKNWLSWGAIGVIAPTLLFAGIGVLALGNVSAEDYIIAKTCFLLLCLVFALKIVEWGSERGTIMSYLVVSLVCAVLGSAALWGVRYVNRKRDLALPKESSEAQATATQEEAKSSEVKADEPKPNLTPVSYGKRHIIYDPNSKTFQDSDSGIVTLVARFRNAHERGKEISEANEIRAHIIFEPFEFYEQLGKGVKDAAKKTQGFASVSDGIWLNEKDAIVNFARGETKTLIVAVQVSDREFGTFDAFEHSFGTRDGQEIYLPKVPKLTADKYVVKVVLTGGARGDIEELFHFTVTLRPEFNISFG